MLLQYELSPAARRRQFLEGLTPAEHQMLEIDVKQLPRQAHDRLIRVGHIKHLPAVPGDRERVCLYIDGSYDALTIDELLPQLGVTVARDR